MGLAKDGHAIYGPYNADNELWDCDDHDICNGRYFSEMDGSYAYVMTQQHPYIIGCWGPAPIQYQYQECSQNTCGSLDGIIWSLTMLFPLLYLLA